MSNLITSWWRSRQFYTALKNGHTQLAQQLLAETQRTGVRLSLLQKVFRDKLQSEQSSAEYKREVLVLREQISQASQIIEELSKNKHQLEQFLADLSNQLEHKEQEIVSIQQQLAARSQELQALHNQLSQREQEIFLIQQQLEVRKRETDSIQHQIEVREQELQALRNQLTQTSSSLVNNLLLHPEQKFIESVKEKFRLSEIGDNLLQCTGIDQDK